MSTLALSGMSIGMLLKYGHITSTLLAFIIAMAIGIACGLVVGLVISRANVPPIIATMGFMYIYRAMGYLVSHGGEWASAAALGEFKNFATTSFLGINKVIWVIIVCYVVFFFFMKWTRTGRRIYAVGSNASAAQVSGINAKNINLLVYVIMGFLAGLGGALQVSVYASAMPDMQYGGEMGCYRSLRYRWCKHERWTWNRSRCIPRFHYPCNDRKSSSACRYQFTVAEHDQGCYHPGSSCDQRCSAENRR